MEKLLMPFGEHKGRDIEKVPDTYLAWLYEQDWVKKYKEVHNYLQENIDAIEMNITSWVANY